MWTSPRPTALVSMYMKNNSILTPFIAYQILKVQESGLADISYMRHSVPEPNCKPLSIPTRSLGAQKATFLFLSLVVAYVTAIIIFGIENMWARKNEGKNKA